MKIYFNVWQRDCNQISAGVTNLCSKKMLLWIRLTLQIQTHVRLLIHRVKVIFKWLLLQKWNSRHKWVKYNYVKLLKSYGTFSVSRLNLLFILLLTKYLINSGQTPIPETRCAEFSRPYLLIRIEVLFI